MKILVGLEIIGTADLIRNRNKKYKLVPLKFIIFIHRRISEIVISDVTTD